MVIDTSRGTEEIDPKRQLAKLTRLRKRAEEDMDRDTRTKGSLYLSDGALIGCYVL
jgi:hypothetical protein